MTTTPRVQYYGNSLIDTYRTSAMTCGGEGESKDKNGVVGARESVTEKVEEGVSVEEVKGVRNGGTEMKMAMTESE